MTSHLNNGYDVANYFVKFEKFIPHSIIIPSFMTIGSQMPELDQATFIDFNFLALHLLTDRYFNCYSQATFWLYIYIYLHFNACQKYLIILTLFHIRGGGEDSALLQIVFFITSVRDAAEPRNLVTFPKI